MVKKRVLTMIAHMRNKISHYLRPVLWVVLCSFLLQNIVMAFPVVSQGSNNWHEVCRSGVLVKLLIDQDDTAPDPIKSKKQDCTFCGALDGGLLLPTENNFSACEWLPLTNVLWPATSKYLSSVWLLEPARAPPHTT